MVCKEKKDLINFNLMKNFLKMKIRLSVYRKKKQFDCNANRKKSSL